jgi:hypothetical protein
LRLPDSALGVKDLVSGVRPTRGVHHFGAADLFIGGIAVTLQNTFELSQEVFWAFTSAAHSEVEYHTASRSAVLPKIGLVIASAAIVHLHIDRCFIG